MKKTLRKTWNICKPFLIPLIVGVGLALLTVQFFEPSTISGESMEPTLHNNDFCVVNRTAYIRALPCRGDIVIVCTGIEGEDRWVKRVIGIEGDTIEFKSGYVYLNDKKLYEPYIKEQGKTFSEVKKVTLDKGEVFCMGDNRRNSEDSRSKFLGIVSVDDLDGKVLFKVYPFDEFGEIK